MAKNLNKPPKKPQKTKDPAKPTRAKAARPDAPATPDALADLLNPAINKGTAGMGSGTGQNPNLRPPPDNSFDRRRDFSAAHTARKSAREAPGESGFAEAPQSDYAGSPITGLDPALAKELGLGDEASPTPPVKIDSTKYRLPRADLPTQPGGFAGMASQRSLEQLLRDGRPEFAAGHGKVWMPHRPERPTKSEGGVRFKI